MKVSSLGMGMKQKSTCLKLRGDLARLCRPRSFCAATCNTFYGRGSTRVRYYGLLSPANQGLYDFLFLGTLTDLLLRL